LENYENLSRFIIPINENYYLLLNIDFEENNFDNIIMEKIIPLVKEEKEKFAIKERKIKSQSQEIGEMKRKFENFGIINMTLLF
jgi:hypothetical protein